jgi:glutamate racemase
MQVAARYLAPLVAEGVDTLILGCTHYPLLRPVLEAVALELAEHPVTVVDSAEATAAELATLLAERELARAGGEGTLSLLVTDLPERFGVEASRFLGRPVDELHVDAIDL